jgi:hypothetical protein
MPRNSTKLLLTFLVACALSLGSLASGCGGNPNEDEYNRTTSPGTPAEPESVAARKARTSNQIPAPVKIKTRGAEKSPRSGG